MLQRELIAENPNGVQDFDLRALCFLPRLYCRSDLDSDDRRVLPTVSLSVAIMVESPSTVFRDVVEEFPQS